MTHGPIALRVNGAEDRYILVEFQAHNTDFAVNRRLWTFSLPFVAFDPFWYSHTQTQVDVTRSDGGTFTVSNAGNARVFPDVTFIGQSGGTVQPRLTFPAGGFAIHYIGTLSSGQQLVMSIRRQTATIGGTGQLNNLASGFFLYPRLDPGNNTLTVNTDSGSLRVQMSYRSRWY